MEKFVREHISEILFAASLVILISAFVRALVALGGITQPLVLHYNRAMGFTQKGNLWELAIMFSIPMTAIIINYLVVRALKNKARLVALGLGGWNVLFASLIFVAFTAIIGVN